MAARNIARLFSFYRLGKLNLDQKLAILEHYDIKFDRREIAREMSNLVADKVKTARRTTYSDALHNLTKEDTAKAIEKVLDKYVREAEARFKVAQTEKINKEGLIKELGDKEGKKAARRLKYRWVTAYWSNRCPQCIERHGKEETMRVWRRLGIPRSGATYCREHCNCDLVAIKGVIDRDLSVAAP